MPTRFLSELRALEAAIEGTVVVAGSPGYEHLRAPVWAQFQDVRPQAVVVCATPTDVAETIVFARRVALETVPRCGGHCFAGRSSTRGILIDLSPMRAVAVVDGTARIGAGALLGDILEQLGSLGLTLAAGACPSVGIAGLTLGGGLGVLGRRYGLTSDQLDGAQVVLADGRLVDCDERRDADLFWGLRGAGGGQFGIVTRFDFRTVPAHDLTCFKLAWPYARAAAAIEAWQTWAPDGPDELAASLLLNAPADLQAPDVTLFGSMLGSESETAAVLDQLVVRLRSDPASSMLEQMTHLTAKRFLAEHAPGAEQQIGVSEGAPPRPIVMLSKSDFFRRPLPADSIAALVDAFQARTDSGHTRELDFTPWGGAYNRVRPDATAFAHRSERFLLKHATVLDADASLRDRDAARDWLATSWSLVHGCGSGRVFPNFPDPDLSDWARAYHGRNYERLTRVKARYDPDYFFRFHQSVPPATAGSATRPDGDAGQTASVRRESL
jgi:FAD/FMN-containing dehydrogenase